MYLELTVSSESSYITPTPPHLNCTISYSGVDAGSIDLDPSNNLLTRTALYVLRCHGQHQFPAYTKVHIHNPIPLGRGLGSSGAAVVGGVILADVCGKLGLSKARVLGMLTRIIGLFSPSQPRIAHAECSDARAYGQIVLWVPLECQPDRFYHFRPVRSPLCS